MIIINYNTFVNIYKPILNEYFPGAKYNGTLFSTADFPLLATSIREKRLWSLVYEEIIVSQIENRKGIVYKIIPGMRTLNNLGYFVTTLPWNTDTLSMEVDSVPIEQ